MAKLREIIETQAIITGTLPTREGKCERTTITKYDNELRRTRKNENPDLTWQERRLENGDIDIDKEEMETRKATDKITQQAPDEEHEEYIASWITENATNNSDKEQKGTNSATNKINKNTETKYKWRGLELVGHGRPSFEIRNSTTIRIEMHCMPSAGSKALTAYLNKLIEAHIQTGVQINVIITPGHTANTKHKAKTGDIQWRSKDGTKIIHEEWKNNTRRMETHTSTPQMVYGKLRNIRGRTNNNNNHDNDTRNDRPTTILEKKLYKYSTS